MNTETCWTYQGNPITEIEPSVVGFIYVITNLLDGRKYYGKKQKSFKKTSYKKVLVKTTGLKKTKKIKSLVDSGWRDYYGSSEFLLADVELLGKENFGREILRFCSSLTEMTYFEMKYQVENDVLLNPSQFYNSYVGGRIHRKNLKEFFVLNDVVVQD